MGNDFVRSFLQAHTESLRLAGGLILCCIGVSMLGPAIAQPSAQVVQDNLLPDYASAMGIALFNPMTVIGFLVGMAAFGTDGSNSAQTVAGVALASSSWYTFMALMAASMRRRLSRRAIVCINQIAALATTGMGLVAAAGALR